MGDFDAVAVGGGGGDGDGEAVGVAGLGEELPGFGWVVGVVGGVGGVVAVVGVGGVGDLVGGDAVAVEQGGGDRGAVDGVVECLADLLFGECGNHRTTPVDRKTPYQQPSAE